MADESHYSTTIDNNTTPSSAPIKRKYDDQTTPSSTRTRPPTGFSDSLLPPPPPLPSQQSYDNVPPPVDDFQLAKQKAQEIAARLLASAPSPDIKRPRVDTNGAGAAFDSLDTKGFSSAPSDGKPPFSSAIPVSYGSYHSVSSKKIDIPNGRVGVIIGKGGETIKYLQNQSGAKIQVTRDMDADPNATTRMVELMGTPDQIDRAEQLINDVLAEADAGGSGTASRRFFGQEGGADHFVMKVPNSKVGLVIGKGGETIKNIQARTGAHVQVVPLHLPPGDTSQERSVHIEGTSEQVEAAKKLVNEVTNSENRTRNPSMAGGYPQQGYQARPPTSWAGAPAQHSGYGYMQPGAYPGQAPQYNTSQPLYAGYPPQQTSGGYPSTWDQSGVAANQQSYDYYSQQPPSQQPPTSGAPAAPTDNTGYNYNQPPASGYNQQALGYNQDGYGGYSQSGYVQPTPYDQQSYGSAHSYANVPNQSQEGHTPSYGAQGDSAQVPPQPPMGQQGYNSGQQPSPNTGNYPSQGTTQSGYGVPPTAQSGYGSQPSAQPGYGTGYGPPQAQKPPANPPVYGQAQQSPSTAGGYSQQAPATAGYPHSQPPTDSGSQRPPPPSYGAAGQAGYGPPYGVPPAGQAGYGHGPPAYNSYGAGYPPPPVSYAADGNGNNNPRGTYEAPLASQPAQQGAVAKASPQS